VTTRSNLSVIELFVEELWNNRNLSVADEIFAPHCITHQLRSGEPVASAARDPETVKQHVREWVSAFPDLQFTLEQSVAAGDCVASQMTMRGSHTGEWMGVSPTGKQIAIAMMTIHRLEAGKIIEDWVLVDSLGFFQQLGLVASREEIFARAG
jgi:predicted ester cyclase